MMGRGVVALLFLLGFASGTMGQEFSLEKTVELCQSCHGENGLPEDREIPIIWGQTWYYIYVQLRDYKAGRRANEIMSEIAADLEKKDMKALASYFSEKKWPRADIPATDAAISRGERHAVTGQCAQCHSTYKGDSRVPRVAGQYPEYLRKTMLDFKNKVRLNSPAKGSLMGSFEDSALHDIAQFCANVTVR